jgi:MFS family permease
MSRTAITTRPTYPDVEDLPRPPGMLHLAFTLAVLVGINTMNFFDRQILSAVQEKIRAEWHLSDSELGWLGTAFILLYAVVGLPLGRLADVWRRKWVLAAGVGLWSVLTAGSGLAWDFASLFALRLGVGVGEASCAPAASSLIGDLVGAKWRARAMSLFMLGLPVGLALSYLVSTTVAKEFGWKSAFFVAGVPGLALAVAALFLAEPRRGGVASPGGGLPFLSVVHTVLSLPTMWWIIASGALLNFNMYALGSFQTSFFMRYHGIEITQAGRISALVSGVGALGLFAGGWLGDLAFRRGVSGRLHVAWLGSAAAIPCLLLALAVPRGQAWSCAAWLLPASVLLYTYYGTVYATIQDIIEPGLRGTAMAIYFCAMYVFAVFGPVATGWLSDYCARWEALGEPVADLHKALGLHDAMHLIPVLEAALVVVLFAASRTVAGDHRRLRKRMQAAAGDGE